MKDSNGSHIPNSSNHRKDPIKEVVVSRFPIFDKHRDVFAYELFFRSPSDIHRGLKSEPPPKSQKESHAKPAAKEEVDSLFIAGLKRLTGGKRAIFNFSSDMILHQIPLLFPSQFMAIGIQDYPTKDSQSTGNGSLIRKIHEIKEAGYLLIINDWLFNEGDAKLVKMADIIGVDFRSPGLQKRFFFPDEPHLRPRFLARSIETPTDYDIAAEKGYQYFQGEFFCKAEFVSIRNIPSYKFNFLRILKEINRPDVRVDQIEEILKRDLSITYKLLRFINSAAFSLKTTVQSIRHALTLMGEAEVRKWLSLIVLSGIGTDKPHELLSYTLIRAKFCEFIAAALNAQKDIPNFFLLGMFSMVDAFLDRPIDEILEELPLKDDVKAALIGKPNLYREVLDICIDFERAEWEKVARQVKALKLNMSNLADYYIESIEWGKLL